MKKTIKNTEKKNALLKATLCLVKNKGFHQAPMSQIAKMADVSPATIYIYFDNKQDLINKLYLSVKESFSEYAFEELKDNIPVKIAFRQVWFNIAKYKIFKSDESSFLCQCDNTPMIDETTREEGVRYIKPLLDLWEKGQREGIIKNISSHILYAFTIYPLAYLTNIQEKDTFTFKPSDLDKTFDIVWDSIRL